MKCRVCVPVETDVDVQIDVDLDTIISEFSQRKEEAAEDYWRNMLGGLDCITRIMAGIPTAVIAKFPEKARKTLRERLVAEADRYWE